MSELLPRATHPHGVESTFFLLASLPGGSREKHGATSNGALLDHLMNDGHGPPRLLLADEALRGGARLKRGGVNAETTDVRVGGHELEALGAALRTNNHRL